MKDILVEVCNLLLLSKLPARCVRTQKPAVAFAGAHCGRGHVTIALALPS